MIPPQTTQGEQKPLPQKILDMNYAFARTAIIVASVRLHLFTALANKSLTTGELAALLKTTPGAMERLLRGLESLELVECKEQCYRLSPTADLFLVEGKPSYLGGDTLAMLDYIPAWFELDQTMQTSIPYRDLGDPAVAEIFFAPRVIDLFPLVFPIASRTAPEVPLNTSKGTLQILDVGAGSAPWSAAFALHYPSAQITALDLPKVVAQGRKHISVQGLEDRYAWIEADMETFVFSPCSYDLILCGHISRFISDERIKALLTRLMQSLRPGGTLLLADVLYAEDHKSPPPAVTLDLSMLVNTAQGRIRTTNEVIHWFTEAGLQEIRQVHVAGPFPVIVGQRGEKI